MLWRCVCVRVVVQIRILPGFWNDSPDNPQLLHALLCFALLHGAVLESKKGFFGKKELLPQQGVLQLLHVPCLLAQTRDGPGFFPSHPQMQTAWCCPSNPALSLAVPAAALVNARAAQGHRDSVTLAWFGGCRCQNSYSWRLLFFCECKLHFVQYYFSCTVLFGDKLPLLVLYCITGSSLSRLYRAGNRIWLRFRKWSPSSCLDSVLVSRQRKTSLWKH